MAKDLDNEDIDFDTENDEQELDEIQDKDAEIAKLRAINERRKAKIESLKGQIVKEVPIVEKKEAPLSDDNKYERLELKIEGYKDNEIDFLMEYGGKKAMANPIIKQAISVMREQDESENAVNGEGKTKSGIKGGHSPDDLKKMSIEQLTKLAKEQAK